MKLMTYYHLVPGLRMSGSVPLLPVYVFMVLTLDIFNFLMGRNLSVLLSKI